MAVSAELVDIVFQCLDALEEYLTCITETADEGTNDNEPIISRLNAVLKGETAVPAAPKEKTNASTEEKKEASQQADFRAVVLKDFEITAAKEAINKGMNFYGLTVQVEENCILKSARAFLVFKNLEPFGEVIRSEPGIQDIEDEKFEWSFSLFIVSKEPIQKILDAILNVSEIKSAVGEEISLEEKPEAPEEKLEKEVVPVSEEKPVTETKEQATKPAAQKPQQANNNGKPVVNRSVRVDIDKLDVLMNLVSELITAKNGIVSVSDSDKDDAAQQIREQVEYLESITTSLHESVMKVRMVPIESVVSRFPRMVRDLSKKLDKKMELYMTGEDTELDRTVIDEIGDPLMHILRNSADHGIESKELRLERGKPEAGSIYLDAYQDGNNVVIEVRDDGNGIDVERVRNKAIEKGTITGIIDLPDPAE